MDICQHATMIFFFHIQSSSIKNHYPHYREQTTSLVYVVRDQNNKIVVPGSFASLTTTSISAKLSTMTTSISYTVLAASVKMAAFTSTSVSVEASTFLSVESSFSLTLSAPILEADIASVEASLLTTISASASEYLSLEEISLFNYPTFEYIYKNQNINV